MVAGFAERGFCRFGFDPALMAWVRAARDPARAALADLALRDRWLVCDGTWFVGVDALDNDETGAIGSVPLAGAAATFAHSLFGTLPLHRAQVSAVLPGYPRPREGESEAAFRFRRRRDAAHIDGLKPFGAERRRRIDELHGWILGIPLSETGPGAAPMVVWEGSHTMMRAALLDALQGIDPSGWPGVDLTAPYHAARRAVFESCARVELAAQPGEAYLVHRLCLHGVAPWAEGARAGPEGRMIAYFRPEMPGGPEAWLRAP